MTDFEDSSSKFGLKIDHFDHLHDDDKKKLVILMARIMERAYRRGVQQTLHMLDKDQIDQWIIDSTHKFRYGKRLDASIGLDGFTTSSIDRLMMEENLETVGFDFFLGEEEC